MSKYKVKAEILMTSAAWIDIEVEAETEEEALIEAKQKAKKMSNKDVIRNARNIKYSDPCIVFRSRGAR